MVGSLNMTQTINRFLFISLNYVCNIDICHPGRCAYVQKSYEKNVKKEQVVRRTMNRHAMHNQQRIAKIDNNKLSI